MVYDLSERGTLGSEESNEELLPRTLGNPNVKESNKESTEGPFTESETMDRIREAYNSDDIAQRIIYTKATDLRKVPQDLLKDSIKLELGDCKVIEYLLYIGKRLYVPNDPELRTSIIKQIHDSPLGGHGGRAATYDRVSSFYYWPKMTSTIV